MAFEMSFTDEYGEVYPNSYWKVVQCNINRIEKTGYIAFYGYASVASLGKRIIATKDYRVDAALYDAFFETVILDPQNENPYRSSYLMSLQVKDVLTGEGQPFVSFFEDAQQV
jgi:hypothetical protein